MVDFNKYQMNLKSHKSCLGTQTLRKKSLVLSVGTLGFGAWGQGMTSAERCTTVMVCLKYSSYETMRSQTRVIQQNLQGYGKCRD